ncbi:MAG: hypothetical protein RL120_18200, partial [Gammaproteobacteria bacterium]
MAFHVTRCPGCDSTFNTNPAVLAAAAGRVRCGACLTVFEAVDNFVAPDPALQEEDGGSVFVSNDPADYFDPSRFLTRRALQEPPRQEESTTPTDLPSELPGPDTLSVPSPVAAAPEVDWDMGTSGQSGPQFTFSADTATELPGDPERFQDSTDFFAAIEQGLPEQQTDLPEDFDSVDAAPP